MRKYSIAIAIATAAVLAATAAKASYWDQCNKDRNQYYDEPFASREIACDKLKSCPARGKCYSRLDADAAHAESMDAMGHFPYTPPPTPANKGECWGPPGEDICGTYAETEKYKRAYKRGANCSTGTPESQQNCKDAKAGKFDK